VAERLLSSEAREVRVVQHKSWCVPCVLFPVTQTTRCRAKNVEEKVCPVSLPCYADYSTMDLSSWRVFSDRDACLGPFRFSRYAGPRAGWSERYVELDDTEGRCGWMGMKGSRGKVSLMLSNVCGRHLTRGDGLSVEDASQYDELCEK
jgi:hypothetical protein